MLLRLTIGPYHLLSSNPHTNKDFDFHWRCEILSVAVNASLSVALRSFLWRPIANFAAFTVLTYATFHNYCHLYVASLSSAPRAFVIRFPVSSQSALGCKEDSSWSQLLRPILFVAAARCYCRTWSPSPSPLGAVTSTISSSAASQTSACSPCNPCSMKSLMSRNI